VGPATRPIILDSEGVTLPTMVPSSGAVFGCSTAAYTADGGELAIIMAKASCGVPTGHGLGVFVGQSLNGGAMAFIGHSFFISNASSGNEDLKNDQIEQLTLSPGTSYAFATGLVDTNGAGFAPNSVPEGAYCYCHTLVQVFR
jgi:hypothetical protein